MRRVPLAVWGFAVLIAALTSLPYLVGALNTPEGWVYSGAPAVPTGAEVDYNSHLAKMWQGLRGDFAYHLLFTHEAHPGLPLVQGFYVLLGVFGHLASLPVVYHLARFLLTLLMVVAIWYFASRYFDKPRERWLALLLAVIAGGWSWLLILVSPAQTASVSPVEFWLLDAFNLLGALTMPHFAAAVILQIVALMSFESWLGQGRGRSLLLLTLALAAESLIQPYVILFFGPLIALWAAYQVFIRQVVPLRRALWLLLPLAIHALLVIYQYLAINGDPVWADFAAQNITMSPPPVYLLLGYLPLLLPALLGLPALWRAGDHWRLLVLWVVLVALLAYAPLTT